MPKAKPLTEARLIAALRKAGFTTKEDVQDELTRYHSGQVVPDLKELRDYLDKRFERLEAGQVEHSRKIDDLRADLSETPTRKEFEDLKDKVDRYHPSH